METENQKRLRECDEQLKAKGKSVEYIKSRKKDPRLIDNRKGSVFSEGRKSVTLKNEESK